MKLRYWFLVLLALLAVPALACGGLGGDDTQTNTITIEGDRNSTSVQICQSGDCTQSNRYGGYGGDSDGEGVIMAAGFLMLCLVGVVVLFLAIGAVGNIEFRT